MSPLRSDEIYGNWATIFLPIEADDSINFDKLAYQIDVLLSMHVNGIYSNGTASEFYNQTEDEFDKINLLLAEKCNLASQRFQIGCGHSSPKLSLERVRRSVQMRPGAIQIVLPDWFPPSFPEILKFLEVMAKAAADIPLVLYNPPHAKVRLLPTDYHNIKKSGIPLAGCKTAGGNETWYSEMKAIPEFSFFVPGSKMATGIRLGASGSYSNVACIHPKVAQCWYESMQTQPERAAELEKRIQLFLQEHVIHLITESNFADPAIDKMLASLTGWCNCGSRLRWPYRSVPENMTGTVRDACRRMLPEFFEES